MLEMYQGNDVNFTFTRKDENGEAITTIPQAIFFTVRQSFQGNILFQKSVGSGIQQKSDGAWDIRIDAEDTVLLNVPGTGLKCVCDVKIVDEYGEEKTIVKPQDFMILPTVTRR